MNQETPLTKDEAMPLSRYGSMLQRNLREERPKMYALLQKQGKLHEFLYQQQEEAKQQVSELRVRGMCQLDAEEIVLPDYILFPSEADQPRLHEPKKFV